MPGLVMARGLIVTQYGTEGQVSQNWNLFHVPSFRPLVVIGQNFETAMHHQLVYLVCCFAEPCCLSCLLIRKTRLGSGHCQEISSRTAAA